MAPPCLKVLMDALSLPHRFVAQTRSAASLTSVAVDAARSQLLVGYFYNSNTGQEPMVMPRVEAWNYAKQVRCRLGGGGGAWVPAVEGRGLCLDDCFFDVSECGARMCCCLCFVCSH
jgi:hypothetical protein